jgi:transcriptional regulator with XRE-family HTH domain
METINERIAFLISDLGISKTKFAERLNISPSFVTRICAGDKIPSDRTSSDICREFNVSLAWLEDGEGEMYVQRSENERMALMFTDVLAEADESTRKRGIAAALEMPPEFWDNILEYAKKITGSN